MGKFTFVSLALLSLQSLFVNAQVRHHATVIGVFNTIVNANYLID